MTFCAIVFVSAGTVAGLIYAEYLNGKCTGDECPPLAFGMACMATVSAAAGLIAGVAVRRIRKKRIQQTS
ncbi:Uncharacterised protein [Escherichia coli]|nr:Uncharacterised protein [Escherichia coli]